MGNSAVASKFETGKELLYKVFVHYLFIFQYRLIYIIILQSYISNKK